MRTLRPTRASTWRPQEHSGSPPGPPTRSGSSPRWIRRVGVSGWTGGAVLDVLLSGPLRRLAVLSTLEAGWNGSREMTVLAPDPARVFHPGEERAAVLWTPGPALQGKRDATNPGRIRPLDRRRMALSPPGARQLRASGRNTRRSDRRSGTANPTASTASGSSSGTLPTSRRFSGGVPFPVEVLFRGSKSVAGTAGATVESRAEAMVRFRIRE